MIQMDDGPTVKLVDVRYIPEMRRNLISLGVLDHKGFKWNAAGGILLVMDRDKVIMRARNHRNLYVLEGVTLKDQAHVTTSQGEMSHLWHMRLGHMSEKGLTILHKQKQLPGLTSSKLTFCEHCVFGKHKRSAFGVGIHSSNDRLEYIHSDVWGKSPVSSHSGKDYYVSFIDDYSRFVWIYFLHKKSDVFDTFKIWRAQVENQTGKKVRCLRSDNGGEYKSDEFRLYCEK